MTKKETTKFIAPQVGSTPMITLPAALKDP